MYTTSMSQIARGHDEPENNASDLAFEGNKQGVEGQNLPEVQSEYVLRQEAEGRSLQYKRQLLRLMVEVRLEDMGYSKKDIKRYASNQHFYPQHLEEVELNELTQLVNQIVMFFVSEGSSEPSMAILRLQRGDRSRRSHTSEQVPQEHSVNQTAQMMNRRERDLSFEHRNIRMNVQPIKPFREILCSICYSLTNEFSEQPCNHSFCDDCFRGYIKQNISSGTYNIACPEYNCTQQIATDNICRLIGKKEYERYIYFRQKNEKELNPNNRFCSQPDCGELLLKVENGLECTKCNARFCEICLQKPHEGSKCDQAIKNVIDHTFETFKIKKCPNCKSPIEKSEGCNHMKCKKCKHQFCWVCLNTYSAYHYKYYNCFGCPGMQFQNEQDLAYERLKQILFYVGAPFILAVILLCYLALVPLYMIGCFFYKPCEWINNNHRAIERDIAQKCCGCCPECIRISFLWILFIFRSALYAIFLAPIKITGIVCGGLYRAIFQ